MREIALKFYADWTTIDPLGNWHYTRWQLVIMLCLIYNMITIPLEIFGSHIWFWIIGIPVHCKLYLAPLPLLKYLNWYMLGCRGWSYFSRESTVRVLTILY